jgi:hypothetical protein
VILAGARRFLIIVAVLMGGTIAGAAIIGLVSGNSLNRSISLGLYGVGSFATIIGFAMTMRGALRPGHQDDRVVEDEGSARAASGLLISAGIVIMLVGMAIDSRVRVL